MLNTPEPSKPETSTLTDFCIEFQKPEPCYVWGDSIKGKVIMKTQPQTQLDVISVKLLICGFNKHKARQKGPHTENAFMKKERYILNGPVTYYDGKKEIPFQETLPPDLATSVETKIGAIAYYLKATLLYKSKDGYDTNVHAVRGFTVIEDCDLNLMPKIWFEERSQVVHRKFGLFSCTGGLVRLAIALKQSAFCSGEYVNITGRIENKSDKRVEKVSAIIQQRAQVRDGDADKGSADTDVAEVFEESLALFVDPGVVLKIEKNMPIPVLPPSTPPDDNLLNRATKRRISIGPLRSRTSQLSLNLSQLHPTRPLTISYTIAFRVKCVGVDNLEICWPIVIGSIPLAETTENNDPHHTTPFFKQCKHDRPSEVLNVASINNIGKTRIRKKISLWANTVRMETKWLSAAREQQRRDNTEKKRVNFSDVPEFDGKKGHEEKAGGSVDDLSGVMPNMPYGAG
ncbi:unnamed protein product, partial [Mesorhabditis spiculigera]